MTAEKDGAAAAAAKVALSITQACPPNVLTELINKEGEFKAISDAAWMASVPQDAEGIAGDALRNAKSSVKDMLRDWESDGKPGLSKFEFRRSVRALVQTVDTGSSVEIDTLFDSFDPDGGGAIDYAELNKALKRRVAPDP